MSCSFIIKNKSLIDSFYKILRPCLLKIFVNLDNLWISHVSENSYVKDISFKHKDKFPEKHWIAYDAQMGECEIMENCFSINMDYLPIKNRCHSHCNNSIIGLMPKSQLSDYNNYIISSPPSTNGRDHPFVFVNEKIPINDWIFGYKNLKDLELIEADCFHMHISNIDKFYRVCKLLIGRIEGFKVLD
jgi:hypothetical protein